MTDNILFEDWQKKQMSNPEFAAEAARQEPMYQQERRRIMDSLQDIDKRVALAMGWTLHEVEPLPPSWHEGDTMICFYHDWYPTSSRKDWSFVEQWMIENFNEMQKANYISMCVDVANHFNGPPTSLDQLPQWFGISALLYAFEAATAPLPMRCRAFLAAVETAVTEEDNNE